MPKPRHTATIRSPPITLSERVETGSGSAGCLSTRLIEVVEQHGWSTVRLQLAIVRLLNRQSQHVNHPKLERDPCRREEGRARIGMSAQSPGNADQTCTGLEERLHHHKEGNRKSRQHTVANIYGPKKSKRRLYKSQP
jgi:hypothetical protein